jgi:hypothetical protein
MLAFPITAPTLNSQRYQIGFFTLSVSTTTQKLDFRAWSISISHGWAAGQTSVAFTTPDLSGLPGWQPEMALETGQPIYWDARRTDSSVSSTKHRATATGSPRAAPEASSRRDRRSATRSRYLRAARRLLHATP